MSPRYGVFTGGIDLPDEKQATLDASIEPVWEAERLLVPLAPAGGVAAEPVVAPGQTVAAGERLASGAEVDVFAPLAGTVRSITTATTALDRQPLRMPVAELVNLSGRRTLPPAEEIFDWSGADAETLRQRIDESRITTLHRRPQPLARWVAQAHGAHVHTLVVNAMENQPYVTADHRLLVEYGEQVMRGLAILARAIGGKRLVLAVDRRRTGDYTHLHAPAEHFDVEHVALPHKYPIGADPILLKVLTRREAPCGGRAADIGAAVTDPATCFAAYRWVACGQRLGGRVVTVSGEHVARPANLFVPFGTEVHVLIRAAKPPYLLNGPMIGAVCDGQAVVGPGNNVVLALDLTPVGAPSQCIRCGWCRDHCPARLNVAVLNDLYELGHVETADRLGALSCVECGVCSYVCPARLPLTQRVRALNRSIRQMRAGAPLFHKPLEPIAPPETT